MNDLNGYIKRMKYSMDEKMFFVDKIDLNEYDLVVDFGCANGDLLRRLRSFRPHGHAIGFDRSKEMIELAKKHYDNTSTFYIRDSRFLKRTMKDYKKVLVIFSSVLHEIESLFDKALVMEVMNLANTIAIRDMFFSERNIELSQRITPQVMNNIFAKVAPSMIYSFQMWHGWFEDVSKNFYHFLLKYTYVENWKNEVQEDYFSVEWDKYINTLKSNGFNVLVDIKYLLEYKRQAVLKDFGFEMSLPTHRIVILTKEEI